MTTAARQRVLAQPAVQRAAPVASVAAELPAPIARWDFEADLNDSVGKLHGEPHGSARLEHGALVLDGKSYLEVAPLPLALREKTLAVWVQCDGLDQRRGRRDTERRIDRRSGFRCHRVRRTGTQPVARRQRRFYARTQPFRGRSESEAQDRPIHMAIVYQADGRITAYRDGQPYGASYVSRGVFTFEPQTSHVLFGLRHSPAGGNKFFKGRIFQAQLWGRALSREQVVASARSNPHYISEVRQARGCLAGKRPAAIPAAARGIGRTGSQTAACRSPRRIA